MANLFSTFDPSAIMGMNLNWVSSLMIVIFMPNAFWLMKSQTQKSMTLLTDYLNKEFLAILGKAALPGILLPSLTSFMFIWLNNMLGLIPYVFTATSHMVLALSLALPLWAGHVVYAWVKTPTHMFSHLVPLGSPAALSPFMVIIELVSSVIRPLTLAVRLAANMVAGHLLMVLVSSPMTSMAFFFMSLTMVALLSLAILETAVATIQAYVFTILTVLYVNEVQPAQKIHSKNKFLTHKIYAMQK